ncbi:T9SS type A sorting domain-containing protein [Hymenobacter yonginensis]|uniref:T9SS type A sorting domain-containing protein n=1 Tax=Hymenobacter yonginensis TaxID=748197 RepID=A0ABY7PNQ9_9BACT|nr:T9SS type A sorting domain-containing protein [Hymenobacter yonginensis]WBO83813.1 T9SS type A sorting domain-containing protein [Hymenobacter yonginensis]
MSGLREGARSGHRPYLYGITSTRAVSGCATCAGVPQTLTLAPNPGTGVFRVLDANGQPVYVTSTVHNTLGKVVQHLNGQNTVDLQAQPAGIYLLKLAAAHGAKLLRVVKE